MKKDYLTLVAMMLISIGTSVMLYQCKKNTEGTLPYSGTSSNPGANEVWMQNTAFNPGSITISVNTTVKWTNKDGMAHTVTSTTGVFDSGTINSSGTYSHQFTTAGTYPYKCTLHQNMTGTVICK